MQFARPYGTLMGALAFVLLGLAGRASAAAPPDSHGPETRPAVDDRAIAVLKGMGDTIARAKSLDFRAESAIAIATPNGQWVHVLGTSHVVLRRPDKLFVQTRGDLFAQDFFFDGKQVTMFAPEQNVYASEPVSGRVDEMLLQAYEKHGTYFPFADALHSDPHGAMTRELTSGVYVGTSVLAGTKTNHLAFAGGGLEWEIWVGAEDQLPRLLNVTYVEVAGRPQNSVVFADWHLDGAENSDATFTFSPPAGAKRIAFQNPGPGAKPSK